VSKELIGRLRPILGVDLPIPGSPWLMTGMASVYGRSNLGASLPALGNVAISNVPGPAATLYIAGARVVHFHPVSIPYHGVGLNITVQSYAGQMEFGITACRRVLSQHEVQELARHLMAALRDLQRLAPAAAHEPRAPAETAVATAPRPPASRHVPAKRPAAVKAPPKRTRAPAVVADRVH
jgi:hypothetical protein